MTNKLSIAFVVSEVDPFSQVGGIGVVGRSLPKALIRMGHKVSVFTPLYGTIDKKKHNLKLVYKDLMFKVNDDLFERADVYKSELMHQLPVYFIDIPKYFSKKKKIYLKNPKDSARFFLFDLAVLKTIRELGKQYDIIHCHDWHTGLIPHYLKNRFKEASFFKNTATVFTIHNLAFQGGKNWWEMNKKDRDTGRGRLPEFGNKKEIENLNFIKRAIVNSDIITTVSETYAEEILTKDYGEALHVILQNRKKRLFGIINGIDYNEYNPNSDPGLYKKYDATKPHRKYENKLALQKFMKLPIKPEVPLVAMVCRITEQKGFDLLLSLIPVLTRQDIQLVIFGEGDKKYEKLLTKAQKKYPKKISTRFKFDSKYETLFYAGSDMLLMPSRFEPCGITQLISARYGSVPIVHAVGGLADTISDYSVKNHKGIGFVFKKYQSEDLLVAMVRALETYKRKDEWRDLVIRAMQRSFSWAIPAEKYVTVYRKAKRLHKQNGK